MPSFTQKVVGLNKELRKGEPNYFAVLTAKELSAMNGMQEKKVSYKYPSYPTVV